MLDAIDEGISEKDLIAKGKVLEENQRIQSIKLKKPC